mmetsp:Transcript_22329/g.26871  ORF Transcript_22329/g.26871 Transcript_22329/m.26871 type:complete len:262 (+) Transcript_22329:156-941(+)
MNFFEKYRHGKDFIKGQVSGSKMFNIDYLAKKRSRSALMVGLDGAGKTSLLCALPQVHERLRRYAEREGVDNVAVYPTTGMQLVEITMARSSHRRYCQKTQIKWRIWDMSGQGRYRSLWMYYCNLVHAVVFVVDANDHDRIEIAKKELHLLLEHPCIHNIPLLILINKIDTLDPQQISPPQTPNSPIPSQNNPHISSSSQKGERTTTAYFRFSIDLLRSTLQLDELQSKYNLDLRIIETSADTGAGIDEAFQWLTDHVVWS